MITYIYAGGGLLALAFIVAAVWFSYRAGKKAAVVESATDAKNTSEVVAQKAIAMAQAEADKPTTQAELFQRLDQGSM